MPEITIPENIVSDRIDKVLAALCPDLSRSRIKALIEEGQVTIANNKITAPSYKVSSGNKIKIDIPQAVDDTPVPENITLDIVYEDEDLIVINKAAGMVVHPAAGNYQGTLVNALLYHCRDNLSGIGGVKRPGIVHRLDKETSGLMVVAKNDHTHQGLSAQLKDRSLSRIYRALVWRVPTVIKGSVDCPIGRHATNRLKMAVRKTSGRDAITHYQMLESFGDVLCWLDCKLESGRTHQIRVHMQHIRHPLVGDPLYGLPDQEGRAMLKKAGYDAKAIEFIMGFERQALHAYELGFIHPRTEEEMQFDCDFPQDLVLLNNYVKSID